MSAVVENPLDVKPPSGRMLRYLAAVAGATGLGVCCALFAFSFLGFDGGVTHDYFSEIAKEGNADWYRDFGGRHIPQI